jgi:hypothetical protein
MVLSLQNHHLPNISSKYNTNFMCISGAFHKTFPSYRLNKLNGFYISGGFVSLYKSHKQGTYIESIYVTA